ncbi:MAG: hypothetical protein AABY92_07880 [Thermodesulfobacteriota bacterium]
MTDRASCRQYLLEEGQAHPELFPAALKEGFVFQGFVHSKKQALTMRRIKLKGPGDVYQLRPSFMMPYMSGRTKEVEKALFLRRWGVPFEALAYVFGRNPMYWYRAYVSLGRAAIVGTTLKDPARLPAHVLADEKHTRLGGEKVYVATTVAQECILGAEVVPQADTPTLTYGYQVFRQEAGDLDPEYTPRTVTTDKWAATRLAWKGLFPLSTLLLCFLHAVLKIKNRCRNDPPLWTQLREKVWHVYGAPTLAAFAQRLRRLREWATPQPLLASAKEKVLELCDHATDFKKAYAHPGAYRTSNALERLMNYQDRLLYAMQYFHGQPASASLYARAMALVWNFHPYDQRTQKKYGPRASPFERVNGFRYHDNWLENMMIAASMKGRRA